MPSPTQTLGLDIGDLRTNFFLISAAGELLEESQLLTAHAALTELFARIDSCRVVLEACGHVHWIAELAEAGGHEVIVANSREVRLISQSGRKNDRNDARLLARLGRVDPELLRPVKLRGEAWRASRSLLRSRDMLVRTRTKLITFKRGQVKSLGGRIPTCSSAAFYKRAEPHVNATLREVIAPLLKLLAELQAQIRGFDERIHSVSLEQHPETALLRQVRGVGPVLALAYVATIEDPERFTSSRTVGNFVGLAPGLYDSGAKTPQLRISKRGDRFLRRMLVNTATYILGPFGEESDLRRFGQRLARGGSQRDKARARIAVARKLACQLHHLWRTSSVWDPNHLRHI